MADTDRDRLTNELHVCNDEIVGLRAEVDNLRSMTSAYLSERDALRADVSARNSIIDALQAKVGRLVHDRENWRFKFGNANSNVGHLQAQVERVTAERDALRTQLEASELRAKLLEKSYDEQQEAMREKEGRCMELQARIDGGVLVYSAAGELWSTKQKWSQFSKILIDAQPIADHFRDATEMVDERVGMADRRQEFMHPRSGSNPRYGKKPIRSTDTVRWVATIEHARSNDRRSTPGTRADRKGN